MDNNYFASPVILSGENVQNPVAAAVSSAFPTPISSRVASKIESKAKGTTTMVARRGKTPPPPPPPPPSASPRHPRPQSPVVMVSTDLDAPLPYASGAAALPLPIVAIPQKPPPASPSVKKPPPPIPHPRTPSPHSTITARTRSRIPRQQQPQAVPPSPTARTLTESEGGFAVSTFPYTTLLSKLPSPNPESIPTSPVNVKKWMSGFQQYIYALLTIVYSDHVTRSDAVTSENLKIFARAFTDSSFSADDYETLETIGDKVLGIAFAKHVYAKRPGVTDRELTNFTNGYMSKEYQSKLSTELKMHEWILFGGDSLKDRSVAATISIREDIFESFAAALDFVATKLHRAKVAEGDYESASTKAVPSCEVVRRFIDAIFDSKGLQDEFARDAAKSALTTIGTLFGMRGKAIYFTDPPKGTVNPKHSVTISKQMADALETEGIQGPIPKFLAVDAPDATTAARIARAELERRGVTDEWVKEQREMSQMEGIEPSLKSKWDAYRTTYNARTDIPNKISKLIFSIPEKYRRPDGSFTMNMRVVYSDDSQSVVGSGVGFQPNEVKNRITSDFLSKI